MLSTGFIGQKQKVPWELLFPSAKTNFGTAPPPQVKKYKQVKAERGVTYFYVRPVDISDLDRVSAPL
jgi:hypothetical protein